MLHKSDSENKLISLTIMNLVTPKAGAKPEFLFNKTASGIEKETSWKVSKSFKEWCLTMIGDNDDLVSFF